MIITVTMNPAIDKTAEVKELRLGGVNRLHDVVLDAGGKGINVSKTLRELRKPSMAIGFLGGTTGTGIRKELTKLQIMTNFVDISGETRTNLKVITPFGMTEFNEPGPKVTEEELNALLDVMRKHARRGNLFVLSGSVPEGVPDTVYATMTALAHECGCSVLLDASGEMFRKALAQKPEYVKPNFDELLQYKGRTEPFANVEEKIAFAEACAQELLDGGVRMAVITLGADGAVFANEWGVRYAPAMKIEVRSEVGAGDSMTAALAYGIDSQMDMTRMMQHAIAISAGACMTEGTKPPARELVSELLRQVEESGTIR